jgi:hypothetical protein
MSTTRTRRRIHQLVFPVSRLFEERAKEYLDLTDGPGHWTTEMLGLEITLAHAWLLCQGEEPEFVKWLRKTEHPWLKDEPAWIELRERRKNNGRVSA